MEVGHILVVLLLLLVLALLGLASLFFLLATLARAIAGDDADVGASALASILEQP